MTESPTRASTDLRALMAQFPSGVSVITAFDENGVPRGMTCSSLCSVTLAPPTLLACLRGESPTMAAIRQRGSFTVNLLHAGAREVAELFASGAPYRFDVVRWDLPPAAAGPHLSEHAHAIADCEVVHTELVGDHVVVFGRTSEIVELPGNVPLLYGLRSYREWPAATP
jgi:flavin reductase (DIM6/NTAB) family NADH-FMN oxidoreductase RutF